LLNPAIIKSSLLITFVFLDPDLRQDDSAYRHDDSVYRHAEFISNAVRLSVFFTLLRPLHWKFSYPHFYRPRIIRAF